MKYHRSTGLLSIEKSTNSISFSDTIYPIAWVLSWENTKNFFFRYWIITG
jgi:hypothetical protein